MPEAFHIFGNDLVLGSNGDLLLVSGPQETQQRLYRRLMTNPGAYIFDLPYGAGLPAKVGEKASGQEIDGLIRGQISHETSVATSPPPTTAVVAKPSGEVDVGVGYVDSSIAQPVALTFTVTPQPNQAGT